jgi:hypothetical protein
MMRVISRFHDDEGNCHYMRADADSNEGMHDQFTSTGRQIIFQGDVNSSLDHFLEAGEAKLEADQREKFNAFSEEIGHTAQAQAPEEPEVEPEPEEEPPIQNQQPSVEEKLAEADAGEIPQSPTDTSEMPDVTPDSEQEDSPVVEGPEEDEEEVVEEELPVEEEVVEELPEENEEVIVP